MSNSSGRSPIDRKLEIEIFDRFSKIVKDKFTAYSKGSKINELDTLYKKPEFNAEKRIINDMNGIGLYQGIMTAVATFAFLRYSPGAISRYLARQRSGMAPGTGGTKIVNPFNQSSGYKLEPPPGEGMMGNLSPVKRPGLLFRAVRLGLDIFVSLSAGAYASLFFLDKSKMMKQFSEIPLVEGRSLLSEELCRDFTAEFQKYDRRTWDENHPSLSGGKHGASDEKSEFVGLVEGFVANCRRRAIYEEEIRKEQGLTEDDPVVIPPPGVPRDIPVSLDDLLQEKSAAENSDGIEEEDDFFERFFDGDNDETD